MIGSPVVIGWIGRPHGLHGAMRARATGPTLPALAPGQEVEVTPPDGSPRRLVLASRAGTADRPVLTFQGVESREDALALTGATIAVPSGAVPPLEDPDTFYVRDLVGCRVISGDRELGAVTRVHSAPANDVLEVTGAGGAVLVPFTADAVLELDPAERRIVVRPDLLGA